MPNNHKLLEHGIFEYVRKRNFNPPNVCGMGSANSNNQSLGCFSPIPLKARTWGIFYETDILDKKNQENIKCSTLQELKSPQKVG